MLDGDVNADSTKMRKLLPIKKSIVILPGNDSPERLIAKFLFNLLDASPIWEKIHTGYDKQFAFKEISYGEIIKDREKAKKWFHEQKPYWGNLCSNVINPWASQNQSDVDLFIKDYQKIIEGYR